ncbi:hypothetical protein KA517_00115 [Candidatus Gracilibacteria bacterium]|nr:hypothetical protein [Candidatus Gracilibacteria bacterium]
MSKGKKVLTVVGALGLLVGGSLGISPQGRFLLANVINATSRANTNVVFTDSGTSGPDLRVVPPETPPAPSLDVKLGAAIVGNEPFEGDDDFSVHRSDNPKLLPPGSSFSYLMTTPIVPSREGADIFEYYPSITFPNSDVLELPSGSPNDFASLDVTCWVDTQPRPERESPLQFVTDYLGLDNFLATGSDGESVGLGEYLLNNGNFINANQTQCRYNPLTGKIYSYVSTNPVDESGKTVDVRGALVPVDHYDYSNYFHNRLALNPYFSFFIFPYNEPVQRYLHVLVRNINSPLTYTYLPSEAYQTPFCASFSLTQKQVSSSNVVLNTQETSDEACVSLYAESQFSGINPGFIDPDVLMNAPVATTKPETTEVSKPKNFIPFMEPLKLE